jgi:hypothetical protein
VEGVVSRRGLGCAWRWSTQREERTEGREWRGEREEMRPACRETGLMGEEAESIGVGEEFGSVGGCGRAGAEGRPRWGRLHAGMENGGGVRWWWWRPGGGRAANHHQKLNF